MSDSARPLGPLMLLIVGVLVALAIFWIGFMLAPAAVLLISYLALSAGERGRNQRRAEANALELPGPSVAGTEAKQDGPIESHRYDRDGQADAVHAAGNQPKGVRA
jgi:hypothetical protein